MNKEKHDEVIIRQVTRKGSLKVKTLRKLSGRRQTSPELNTGILRNPWL